VRPRRVLAIVEPRTPINLQRNAASSMTAQFLHACRSEAPVARLDKSGDARQALASA
jgi:hypothetical protein